MMRLKGAKTMANVSTKEKIYQMLRGQISVRLMRTAGLSEQDLDSLSLAETINTLFLLYGHYGALGNFSVSFEAALKLVGRELMWQEPEVKPAVIEADQRVN